ncbi:MAG TPA: hypothetical protein VMF69_03355 [Gemmataceae bacterium]|nr:hypothetical protein [Gemmataceae bacterium]
MYPHRIRLRGPWECEPLFRRGDKVDRPLPPPCRIVMPCRWSDGGLAGFTGRVRFRRSFGYPGRIDAYERVWLTFAGMGGAAEVQLNNLVLGCISEHSEFEVTSLLKPRNELVVEIECASEQEILWDEAALEVRCTAFLRDLRIFATSKDDIVDLRVSGQVVGVAERPLELYLLLDRSVVAYQLAAATDEGQRFEIVVPDIPAAKWLNSEGQPQSLIVQVDLVNGAVVWYTSNSLIVPTPKAAAENCIPSE